MEASAQQNYIPGVCNIGPAEIKARKKTGWIGLIVTIILWLLFNYLKLSAGWFLFLFCPATLSAAGFIQGITHFCAGFGMKGLFNFGSEVGKTDTIIQSEFRAKDRKKAVQIFAYSVLIGLLISIMAFIVK